MNEENILLVVGLGNPGDEYEGSRHNAGFCVIDVLADDLRVNYWKRECDAEVGRAKINGCVLGSRAGKSAGKTGNKENKKCSVDGVDKIGKADKANNTSKANKATETCECEIILAKPQTFMNLSGNAVRGLCKTYSISPDHVIVIHDELDIPPATIRVKFGGGHAGHNGLKSICDKLGTRDWYRVRVGVGRPPGKMDVARYVLGMPKGEDADNFATAIHTASEAVPYLIQNGLERTQQEFN